MNKLKKITLSVLGGIDTTFYIFTPIMISVLMDNFGSLSNWQINFIFTLGFLSTTFRAIKVGWLK